MLTLRYCILYFLFIITRSFNFIIFILFYFVLSPIGYKINNNIIGMGICCLQRKWID